MPGSLYFLELRFAAFVASFLPADAPPFMPDDMSFAPDVSFAADSFLVWWLMISALNRWFVRVCGLADSRSQTVIVRIYVESGKRAAMSGSMKASMTAIRPPSMLRTCTPRG
jgi:hypothetical protein